MKNKDEKYQILKRMDRITPFGELDEERWKELLEEFKDCVMGTTK